MNYDNLILNNCFQHYNCSISFYLEQLIQLFEEIIFFKSNNTAIPYDLIEEFEEIAMILPETNVFDLDYLFYEIIESYNFLNIKQLYNIMNFIIEQILINYDEELVKNYNLINNVNEIYIYDNFDYLDINKNAKEIYREVNSIVNKYMSSIKHESYLEKCEISLKSYLKTTTSIVSRKQIENNVEPKYKPILYKFLKPNLVLDYKGAYLYVNNLKVNEEDILGFEHILNIFTEDDEFIHIDYIYDYFLHNFPDFLEINHIVIPYSLFSVLEYLLKDKYQFNRPYISNITTEMYNKNSLIKDFILENTKLKISDIVDYERKLKIPNQGILSIIEELTDFVSFENKNNIVNWSEISISELEIENIEEQIYRELKEIGTCAIVDLQCCFWFPELNIEWDEWFLYSLIKKYSKRINVFTSSRTLKYAIPIISTNNYINEDEITLIQLNSKDKKISKQTKFEEIEIDVDFDDLFEEDY